METTEREKLIQAYLESYNQMDVPAMMGILEESIFFENYSGAEKTHEIQGKSAFESQAKTALSYFFQRKQVPLSFIHRENETEVQIEYWAILAMDFPNGLKKGQELRLQGKSIFQFGTEKIKGIQDFS
ncbi:nuclear transport factor 2-like protein [Algoriphagus litoralis]|uniref:nuclear transport factor 2 family protein n=1 Tax=Algoriphagus litoralis TaxID=2202829 RepID=UPI000DB95213|nr:nuclear transport factor 2 family protein [Algoriphagus litoralis]